MRWQCGWVPTQRHATNPEKVLVYRKRTAVNWRRIDRHLQNVSGLDDVFRIDLHQFCRHFSGMLNSATLSVRGMLHGRTILKPPIHWQIVEKCVHATL